MRYEPISVIHRVCPGRWISSNAPSPACSRPIRTRQGRGIPQRDQVKIPQRGVQSPRNVFHSLQSGHLARVGQIALDQARRAGRDDAYRAGRTGLLINPVRRSVPQRFVTKRMKRSPAEQASDVWFTIRPPPCRAGGLAVGVAFWKQDFLPLAKRDSEGPKTDTTSRMPAAPVYRARQRLSRARLPPWAIGAQPLASARGLWKNVARMLPGTGRKGGGTKVL